MTLWDESPRPPLTEEQIRAVHRRAFELRDWRPRATDEPEPKPKESKWRP